MGVALVTKYAQHLGATARRVHLFTVEQPWNDYDDGFVEKRFFTLESRLRVTCARFRRRHYQMELHRGPPGSKWELWDLDFNIQPMSNGKPVTALEMLNLVRERKTQQIELRPIAVDALYDVSGFAFVSSTRLLQHQNHMPAWLQAH